MEAGNHVTDSSFLRAMKAFERYIGRQTHVADVVRVLKVDDSKHQATCQPLTDSSVTLVCDWVDDLEISAGNVCLVLFTDLDNRDNLLRIRANLDAKTDIKTDVRHSSNFGIIIAKIGGVN